MEVKEIARKDAIGLRLNGSLDIYTSLELKNKIEDVINKDIRTLVIDLENVDYVDSSGIGTLIKGLNLSKEKKIGFAIVGVQPSIEKVFKVAGLLSFFTILSRDEYDSNYPIA